MLPIMYISNVSLYKIVEMDASDIGWGVLKQIKEDQEQIIQFSSGVWNPVEKNYSTIKKEVKVAWNCIDKFDIHLIKKIFILITDVSAMKKVLTKDIKKL